MITQSLHLFNYNLYTDQAVSASLLLLQGSRYKRADTTVCTQE